MRISTINKEFEKLLHDLRDNGYQDAYFFVSVAHKSFSNDVLNHIIDKKD